MDEKNPWPIEDFCDKPANDGTETQASAENDSPGTEGFRPPRSLLKTSKRSGKLPLMPCFLYL
jgi:hypothetical protein